MSYSKPSTSFGKSSSMPPANDLLKIAGLTLIPFGTMYAGWLYSAKHGEAAGALMQTYKKPFPAIQSNQKLNEILDYLTIAPMGYAAFLVTQDGVARTDVKQAVGAFGATVATMYLWCVSYTVKDLKCWIGASAFTSGVAGITAYLFGKVDPLAGKLMVPFAVWTGFCSALFVATYLTNDRPKLNP